MKTLDYWLFAVDIIVVFLAGAATGVGLVTTKLRRDIRLTRERLKQQPPPPPEVIELPGVEIEPGESVDIFVTIKDGKPEVVVRPSKEAKH